MHLYPTLFISAASASALSREATGRVQQRRAATHLRSAWSTAVDVHQRLGMPNLPLQPREQVNPGVHAVVHLCDLLCRLPPGQPSATG